MDIPAGFSTVSSGYAPRETMDRLIASVTARNMTIFARIDHGAGAAEAGLPLRPTELLIFGHARGGTPLMQAMQTIGIDLPLKALVWQDGDGATWVGYNEPGWIASRHGLVPDKTPAVPTLEATLSEIAREAVGTVESLT